jgi:hypothetical protein
VDSEGKAVQPCKEFVTNGLRIGRRVEDVVEMDAVPCELISEIS